jgi:hypothetical protein
MTALALVPLLVADRLADPQEIVRRLSLADERNREIARSYTFIQRGEQKEIDGKGKVKKVESETEEVLSLYGRYYSKTIAKNDKPLSAKDAAKEEEKLRKESEKRARESREENGKLAKEQAKQREELRKLVTEIGKAYDLTLKGIEKLDGRDVYKIAAMPRADYSRKLLPYSMLPKMRGTMWIDCDEFQLVRIDAEVIETISLGLVLVRFGPGTRLFFEQTRVNGEVWLPRYAAAKLEGRVGVLKKVRSEAEVRWKDFRKFSADSRVVAADATPE